MSKKIKTLIVAGALGGIAAVVLAPHIGWWFVLPCFVIGLAVGKYL